jgi:CheY-like chemotaxis protein
VSRRIKSPVIDLMLVEDNPGDIRLVQEALLDAKLQVNLQVAANGVEALQMLEKSGPPDVVLTDLKMPVMDGLELVESLRRSFPDTPVILMTAYGTEEVALQALRKGAASYVPKDNVTRDLVNTLAGVLEVSGTDRYYQRMLSGLQQTSVKFVLENDPSLIPALVGYLDEHLSCLGFADEMGLIRIGIALREALLNAMFHGSFELASEQLLAAGRRSDSGRSYHELVEERRSLPPYRDRRVHVEVEISRQSARFSIRDEGPGFDRTMLRDPTDPMNIERESGRGLLLIYTFMDVVSFNESGNMLTMIKHADSPSSGTLSKPSQAPGPAATS